MPAPRPDSRSEGAGLVVVGRVAGAHGVRGWVRVWSDTDPPENVLGYSPWWLGRDGRWREVEVLETGGHGRRLVVRLAGCEDRGAASALVGAEIAVPREQLPALADGDYYWVDLVGLEVRTRDGVPLGRVGGLMHTGANDVLVVEGERERLIPWVEEQVVVEVDRVRGRITVDWDPDF